MGLQVKSGHYYKGYDSKSRFCSYWHQINEIILCNPHNVLEIGTGNGFVSSYLIRYGFNVVSLDVDKQLKPTITASGLNIPFSANTFEVVACYQTLEHLPYSLFKKTLKEIRHVSSSRVFLSLPDSSSYYRVFIQIPMFGLFRKILQIPLLLKRVHYFDGQHYWEIGKVGYSLKTVINDMREVGFEVEKTYRVFENPYHRFFILKRV